MNNRIKTILGLLAFVVLIGIAYFAYNNLSGLYKPDDTAQLPQENGQALLSDVPGPGDSLAQNSNAAQSPVSITAENTQAAESKSSTWQIPAGKSPAGAAKNTVPGSKPQNNTAAAPAPGSQNTAKQPAPRIEKDTRPKADGFTVQSAGGKSVKLSNFFGKPIVVNFWASWCPPCRSEMPHFNKAYADYKGQITFLMVDLVDGQRETVNSGQNYINNEGYTFPVYFDTKQSASYAYRIQSIPMTLFIDSGGHIVQTVRGAMDESTLRRNLENIK